MRCCIMAMGLGSVFLSFCHGQTMDFNRDIRPILSSQCFQCHGPDDDVRKAGLRLDRRETAIARLKSGRQAIVPGAPDESELIRRITATDDSVMPPVKTGKRLTPPEVATLRRWIQEGAKYTQHWSYVPPVRPPLPRISPDDFPKHNPIDHFIAARLQPLALSPNPPADRYTLIRRVTLDLIGLPPTVEEVDQFVNDPHPDAYDRLVDRLLASPRYGERWAQVWLDLARYADSQGFANDPDRTIWRWRDWLIGALNGNLPFDQFTIEMLAGDLLPQPTTEQLVATGFHRNTLVNSEGGTNPEEFRSAAVVDRVNTTMQVWMGTTINCCQCHNHKYDPITQREFYQVYAIWNNTQDANTLDDAPTLRVPRLGNEKEFADVEARLADLRAKFDGPHRDLIADVERSFAIVKSVVPERLLTWINRDGKLKERWIAEYRSKSELGRLEQEIKALESRRQAISTTTPILREGTPRPTHIHIRGNHLEKGEAVQPGLPAVFPAPAAGQPLNRLTFARWLVSAENPLTARVAVNRLWEELFGVGIVETSEEFGTQGELPSHPDLLDWLATEYIRLGWDTKAMLKLLVSSATYRQSSAVTAEKLAKDPSNRLLSRGPRVRHSAEMIRDQALAVGGLLSPKLYGPPVQPPKPNFGLTAAFGSTTDWQPSSGEDRYRRALYTRIRRNAPYPAMTTFDAPERTACQIRRLRTNTPLQALVTLNDPVHIEAAQGLARRIANRSGDVREKVIWGFRTVLSRPPSTEELERVVRLYEEARQRYAADAAAAVKMATQPLGPLPAEARADDLAAWTVVGNVLLNLDETIHKP